MTSKQWDAHIRAIAKNIGVAPEHREVSDEEFACAAQWMKLRGNAYGETMDYQRQSKG